MNEYFPHDFYARTDTKMTKIFLDAGWEGRAIFWDLVEMMYENGGKLRIDEINEYAYALRTTSDCITKVLNIAFKRDDTYFWSESVLKRIKVRNEKSEKAKQSAKSRWDGSERIANAKRTLSEGNAIKEKEIKLNKRKDINTEPSAESKNRTIGNITIPKPTSSNEWQMMAVDYAGKLGIKSNPSWFKAFKDHSKGSLLKAFQVTVDRNAADPERFFYKVLGGQNAPSTTQ